MTNKSNYEYLLSDLTKLRGVGVKTTNLLKKKRINNIFDLLWKLPKSYTDRSRSIKIKDLKIGEVQTVTVIPKLVALVVERLEVISATSTVLFPVNVSVP